MTTSEKVACQPPPQAGESLNEPVPAPLRDVALQQICWVRDYTKRLIDHVPEERWFDMPKRLDDPSAAVTHVAWQVGHLAMAEYRLALERVRGTQPHDEELISTMFLKTFAKESVPSANPADYPTVAEIRRVFDRVHARVLEELPHVDDVTLALPPFRPHPLFLTRLNGLHWCSHHEAVHAGQIGLLRRLIGLTHLW